MLADKKFRRARTGGGTDLRFLSEENQPQKTRSGAKRI
jgi:hypothetical protein